MGLASAMSTALTGLSASETTIDVVGNNLANSNTVGFKASQATFATQFLQTQSVGASPTSTNGGQNPRQEGLGTMVSEITPNFTQGTIEVSNSPTDLAIQGDGFFITQGSNGQTLYSRNGVFKTNSQNQLVTTTGNRIMGYGVDNQFNIDTTQLTPLQVPLGTAMVAKATAAAVMQGALTPNGNIQNKAQIIQSVILTDGSKTYPPGGPNTALGGAGVLSGKYSYYVTYANGNLESRPQPLPVDSPLLNDNQVQLSSFPWDASQPPQWTSLRIYRNTTDQAGDSNYYKIGEITPPPITSTDPVIAAQEAAAQVTFMSGQTYTDNDTDASIRLGGQILNMHGPAANSQTLLKDIVTYDGSTYSNAFPLDWTTQNAAGTLQFTGTKGGRTLTAQSVQVTSATTLRDLANFLQGAEGIQASPGSDATNPIPVDSGTGQTPGATVTTDGKLQIVSNNGYDNAVGIGLSALQWTTNDVPPKQIAVNVPFNVTQDIRQDANNKTSSTVADMIAYDSLGMPLSVRITTVLQGRDSTSTTYRWYADCGQNDPAPGQQNIAVGTGVLKFDGNGNLISSSNSTVSIGRYHEPSVKPLQFNLDFTQVSGLASSQATLSVARQDGSAPGVLNSFIVGQDGKISGVFSNGISRDLGQIRLARFANPSGLVQQGQNMYATGVNSGLPIEGNPGSQGTGAIVSGSLELSNTDIGSSLINLILASTMYRSNTRVVTTSQQMFDELLQLMR